MVNLYKVQNSGEIPVEIPVQGHFPGFSVPESPESFFKDSLLSDVS
jgi:hypothetical protein